MPDKDEPDIFEFLYNEYRLFISEVESFGGNATVIERCLQEFGCHLAEDIAKKLLEALNTDQSNTLPTLDYVIIVGQQKQRPNKVVIVVYNEKHGEDGEPVARIEHWYPNDNLLEKAGGYEVFNVL